VSGAMKQADARRARTSAAARMPSAPRVAELFGVLDATLAAFRELADLADQKLAAIRQADTAGLQAVAGAECAVLERVFTLERDRQAILARLAQALPARTADPPRLSQIAAQLPEPLGPRLQAKIAGLRDLAARLQQKNRLAATVARRLHNHIRAVFDELARSGREAVVYGPNGQRTQGEQLSWIDAVG